MPVRRSSGTQSRSCATRLADADEDAELDADERPLATVGALATAPRPRLALIRLRILWSAKGGWKIDRRPAHLELLGNLEQWFVLGNQGFDLLVTLEPSLACRGLRRLVTGRKRPQGAGTEEAWGRWGRWRGR